MTTLAKNQFTLEALEPRVLLAADGSTAVAPSQAGPQPMVVESASIEPLASGADQDFGAAETGHDFFAGMKHGALDSSDAPADSPSETKLENSGTGADSVFQLPDGGTDAILESDSASGKLKLRSTDGSFEETTFDAPAGSLEIDLGQGDDTLNIQNLDSAFAGKLIVRGNCGTDA